MLGWVVRGSRTGIRVVLVIYRVSLILFLTPAHPNGPSRGEEEGREREKREAKGERQRAKGKRGGKRQKRDRDTSADKVAMQNSPLLPILLQPKPLMEQHVLARLGNPSLPRRYREKVLCRPLHQTFA